MCAMLLSVAWKCLLLKVLANMKMNAIFTLILNFFAKFKFVFFFKTKHFQTRFPPLIEKTHIFTLLSNVFSRFKSSLAPIEHFPRARVKITYTPRKTYTPENYTNLHDFLLLLLLLRLLLLSHTINSENNRAWFCAKFHSLPYYLSLSL